MQHVRAAAQRVRHRRVAREGERAGRGNAEQCSHAEPRPLRREKQQDQQRREECEPDDPSMTERSAAEDIERPRDQTGCRISRRSRECGGLGSEPERG